MMNGLPLLSQVPPGNSDGSDETACRKCSKEFNFLFARQKRCHHCGYAYCSSCADFQALMPRSGLEAGYEAHAVCAYCVDMLNVTASSKAMLRSLPLAKLRSYMNAYNIATGSGALEKDDLVEAILRARGTNGCLLPAHEEFYRNNSVPRKPRERLRTRSFFSRHSATQRQTPQPPPPATHRHAPAPTSAPPDASSGQPQQPRTVPSSHIPPPLPQRQRQPASPLTSRAPDANTGQARPSQPDQPPAGAPHHGPPPRYHHHYHPAGTPRHDQSAERQDPPGPSRSPPPVPSLDALLEISPDEISHLPISTLKAVLFENRVNSSTGILEKQDLVLKVLALVKDERKDRQQSEREAQEEAEKMESARIERERQEQERKREEGERKLAEQSSIPAATAGSYTEKDGLCVICCDAHANMAIIDCGHLALCKSCSEVVMKTTRECPLCRTRIITEQRLLRIFKS